MNYGELYVLIICEIFAFKEVYMESDFSIWYCMLGAKEGNGGNVPNWVEFGLEKSRTFGLQMGIATARAY